MLQVVVPEGTRIGQPFVFSVPVDPDTSQQAGSPSMQPMTQPIQQQTQMFEAGEIFACPSCQQNMKAPMQALALRCASCRSEIHAKDLKSSWASHFSAQGSYYQPDKEARQIVHLGQMSHYSISYYSPSSSTLPTQERAMLRSVPPRDPPPAPAPASKSDQASTFGDGRPNAKQTKAVVVSDKAVLPPQPRTTNPAAADDDALLTVLEKQETSQSARDKKDEKNATPEEADRLDDNSDEEDSDSEWAVYKESPKVKRRPMRSDRWANSGGIRGSRDLPYGFANPIVRRRYGTVGAHADEGQGRRYYEYTLLRQNEAGETYEDETATLFHIMPATAGTGRGRPTEESAKPAAIEDAAADPLAETGGASGNDDDGGFGAADDSDVLYRSDFYPSDEASLMPTTGVGSEHWLDAPMPGSDMGAVGEVTMFAAQDELMGMPQSATGTGELAFD